MSNDDEKPTIPVSPSTGLDPEVRQFLSRMMAGYEAAHRTIADMSESMARAAKEAQDATAKAIQMQLKFAEEREEMLSKRHVRELEAKQAEIRTEAFAKVTADVRAALMLTAKKYLGLPLSGNDSHGLQDLLSTLSGEQIDSVMTEGRLELTVAQRQLLASTLTSLAEDEQKAKPTNGSS